LNLTAITGTAQTGAASTITLASGASSTDGFYTGWYVKTTCGTGSGQIRYISGYVGSTKVATVSEAWTTTPDNTTTYSTGPGGVRCTDNEFILRTTGKMSTNAEVLRVQGGVASEVVVTGNRLIRAGNETAITSFINVASDVVGLVADNFCADKSMNCVNITSTNTGVRSILNNGLSHVLANTATTYTINMTDNGNIRTQSNASAITTTLPNSLPRGFRTTVEQLGAGQITFSAESGGSITSYSSLVKTAGQYAVVEAYVRTNTTGKNAAWVLTGDLGA
jgi:hypothetical protein